MTLSSKSLCYQMGDIVLGNVASPAVLLVEAMWKQPQCLLQHTWSLVLLVVHVHYLSQLNKATEIPFPQELYRSSVCVYCYCMITV